MTMTSADPISMYIEPETRRTFQDAGEHLRQRSGGRGGISRGARFLAFIYRSLTPEQIEQLTDAAKRAGI